MNKFKEVLGDFYKNANKFLQIFANIIILILIVYIFICALKLLYLWLGRVYFSWVVSIVLISLVITNEKIKLKGKLILIFIFIIQFLMYYYWDILYIDLIKDIFWFSLILNISFIWHNLILDRIISNIKKENQYIRFIIIRISWITSIILWVAIVKNITFVVYSIHSFFEFHKIWPMNFKVSIRFYYIWNKIMKIKIIFILALIESILWYFVQIFENYSLFLMGMTKLNIEINWKLILFLLIFLLTFIVSIYLNIARIYLFWMILVIYKIFFLIKKEFDLKNKLNIKYNKGKMKKDLIIESFFFNDIVRRWLIDYYFRNYEKYIDDIILKGWEEIYEKDMYTELLVFIEKSNFNRTYDLLSDIDWNIYYEYFNRFDLLYLFWYTGNIDENKIKLVLRVDDLKNIKTSCDYFDTVAEEIIVLKGEARIETEWIEERKFEKKILIARYGLELTLEEYIKRIDKREYGIYPLIIRVPEKNPITLKEYLGLKQGSFIILNKQPLIECWTDLGSSSDI